MKKTFLICPVRKQKEDLTWVVEQLEKDGWQVHYPPRDTEQSDPIGYQICQDNRKAIAESDVVHIYYDPESRGSLFDLGMAFAYEKKLIVINHGNLELTDHKSFVNMIIEWQNVA